MNFTLYLIHFNGSISDHAKHYIGYTWNLDARMARHRSGDGAKLLRACNLQNIDYRIVRIWKVQSKTKARRLEIILKNRKNFSKMCPKCNPKSAILNGNFDGVRSEFYVECNHNTVSNSNPILMMD